MGLPTIIELIENEELRIGTKLPRIIRQALLKNNGGIECKVGFRSGDSFYLFPVRDQRTKRHIRRSANFIELETLSAQEWVGFPRNTIAIGNNGSGDYLIFEKNSEAVNVWCHETREIHIIRSIMI